MVTPLTHQDIFNRVSTHLLRQGARAMVGDMCYYRTSDGLTCAVGCLIPIEVYDPAIEEANIPGLFRFADARHQALEAVLAASGIQRESFGLLARLQNVHDGYLPDKWAAQLDAVRDDFGLDPPPGDLQPPLPTE